jgi:hypothetical protein
MDINDFRLYSVIVEGGSGVLFQSMNNLDYTYVLTAKHNLFAERPTAEDERKIEKYQLDKVDIFIPVHNETVPIVLPIIIGKTYFPHDTADIAILKIVYIASYQEIYINKDSKSVANTFVCGYPGYHRGQPTFSKRYNSYEIKSFISDNGTTYRVQLTAENKDQLEIKGFSGGGILKIVNNCISLVGIQSEVSSREDNGQIEFVPVKYFEDIINDPEYEGKLTPLFPPYMGNFNNLKDEIIKLEDAINPKLKGKIKSAFYEHLKLISICPHDIYTSEIGDRLFIGDNIGCNCISKKLWISWLEYLIVLSFITNDIIDISFVQSYFDRKRLLYSETESSWLEIIPELIKHNTNGLKANSTVIISTNSTPPSRRRFNAGMLTNIFQVRCPDILTIDQAHNIKSIKEIIHITAFELDCILEAESVFNEISILDIEKIISVLKTKIYEFLQG